jgi:thiol-disulfide isomerase/thioredoxin
MSEGQRSNWLAQRIGIAGLGLTLIAAVLEFRPTSSDVPWRTYDQGVEEAKATGKPMYIDVYATWCGPCKEMDRVTFRADSVRALLLSAYVPVRIDIDTKQLSDSLKSNWAIKVLPTSLILAARGTILGRRTGYQHPGEFVAWLTDPAIIAYAGWLDYATARQRSAEVGKPTLVVLTRGPENLEEIQTFFLEPRFRAFLQERFVVTRVTGEGYDEQAQYTNLVQVYSLAPAPKDGLVLLALGSDGRELGQVLVRPEELEDQQRIMGLLTKYLKGAKVE